MKTDKLPEGVPKYVDFSDNGKVTRFELHPIGKVAELERELSALRGEAPTTKGA